MENSSLSAMLLKVRTLADQVVAIANDGGFFDFAIVVDKVTLILRELSSSCNDLSDDAVEIRKAVESVGDGLNRVRVLLTTEFKDLEEEELEDLKRELSRSVELVALTCVDFDEDVKKKIEELRKEMKMMMVVAINEPRRSCEIEGLEVGVEDVVMQIKNGGIGSGDEEEELLLALWTFNDFVRERAVDHEWIRDENVVEILLNRLNLVKSSNVRSTIIKILRNLVAEHPDHKVDNQSYTLVCFKVMLNY